MSEVEVYLVGGPREGKSYVDQDIMCQPENKTATLRCNDNGIASCKDWKKCPTWKTDRDKCPAMKAIEVWEKHLVKLKRKRLKIRPSFLLIP